MTPKQALELLNQAAGAAPLNRETHMQVTVAYQTLYKEIDPKGYEQAVKDAEKNLKNSQQ